MADMVLRHLHPPFGGADIAFTICSASLGQGSKKILVGENIAACLS
jgi:hypothetical protein